MPYCGKSSIEESCLSTFLPPYKSPAICCVSFLQYLDGKGSERKPTPLLGIPLSNILSPGSCLHLIRNEFQ